MADFPYEISQHAAVVIADRAISLDWIRRTLENPYATEIDQDDPILRHALALIPEYGGRTLRVVYNPASTPWRIVTCFFDRRVKGSP